MEHPGRDIQRKRDTDTPAKRQSLNLASRGDEKGFKKKRRSSYIGATTDVCELSFEKNQEIARTVMGKKYTGAKENLQKKDRQPTKEKKTGPV